MDNREAGRLGGLKGGRARAAALSPERRREIAQKAIDTRWGRSTDLPRHSEGCCWEIGVDTADGDFVFLGVLNRWGRRLQLTLVKNFEELIVDTHVAIAVRKAVGYMDKSRTTLDGAELETYVEQFFEKIGVAAVLKA